MKKSLNRMFAKNLMTDHLCQESLMLKEPDGCSVFTRDPEVMGEIRSHNALIVSECHLICADIGNVQVHSALLGTGEVKLVGAPCKIQSVKDVMRACGWLLCPPMERDLKSISKIPA